MMLRQNLLLLSYLVESDTRKFAWGQWDCNLFLSNWVDRIQGVNSTDEIVGKYSTALGAAKFYKNYMTVPEYLKSWQYKPVDDDQVRTGDILLEHDKLWVVPYIVCNDHAYTIHHNANLVKAHIDHLEHLEIWRS
jgi:hypothetical protein